MHLYLLFLSFISQEGNMLKSADVEHAGHVDLALSLGLKC